MASAANLNDVQPKGFFTDTLKDADPAIADAIRAELRPIAGVVDAFGAVGAKVEDLMPGFLEPGGNFGL